ncbi:MAG: hypothetical protein ABIY55_25565 [Kofleriaceae bacterium]
MTGAAMSRAQLAASLAGLGLALAGCVEHDRGVTGTQSIRVELTAPQDPGAIDRRLPDENQMPTITLSAYDAAGELDTSFESDVDVYVQFLGTLTPTFDPTYGTGDDPLATIHMANGVSTSDTIQLPLVFGPTTLWVDDARSADPTYATGASPIIWYRDPFIADIQRPLRETAVDALTVSPLQNKQITINASRYGTRGRLVVTSVFAQGYTVSDVQCADDAGTPPCIADAYDHVEVFSFSAPRGGNGRLLEQGQTIDGFSGGISEFNGLTEIGFPVTFGGSDEINPARVPDPVKLDVAWFNSLSDPAGRINFERNEAGAIEIDNAVVCPLDKNYDTFNQWKLDPSGTGDCGNDVLNVITAGVVNGLDPATLVGKTLPRVVGMLRPLEIGNFNVWIIFPRSAADLTLPPQ